MIEDKDKDTGKNSYSMFGLTVDQTQVLFSLQRLMLLEDIKATNTSKSLITDTKKRASAKSRWYLSWRKSINYYLSHLDNRNLKLLNNTYRQIEKKVSGIDEVTDNNVWKYLILLECICFNGYTPLGETEDEIKASAKKYAGLKMLKASKEETLLSISKILNVDPKYIKVFQKSLKSAHKQITGFWAKSLKYSLLAAIIVAILLLPGARELVLSLAPSGIHGGAAINAGLAALGGGAVAAGGLGMAGGISVLVGGGLLLSIGIGGSVGTAIASISSDVIMNEAVKLEVVLKEIVLSIQKDTVTFEHILNKLVSDKKQLEIELEKLQKAQKENEDKIKELEKSILYMERLIRELRS